MVELCVGVGLYLLRGACVLNYTHYERIGLCTAVLRPIALQIYQQLSDLPPYALVPQQLAGWSALSIIGLMSDVILVFLVRYNCKL